MKNNLFERRIPRMARKRKSVMSPELKQQIASELGFGDTLRQEGFAGVSSRNCGNMVKKAIELAERNMPRRTM